MNTTTPDLYPSVFEGSETAGQVRRPTATPPSSPLVHSHTVFPHDTTNIDPLYPIDHLTGTGHSAKASSEDGSRWFTDPPSLTEL